MSNDSFRYRGHEVFISYSTKNSEIANKIRYSLEQNGLPCF